MLRASGFFALRAPLLPFETLFAWAEAGDEAAVRRRLFELVESPAVRDALLVGSSNLLDAVAQQEGGAEARLRQEAALARYLARMSGRATPYGLFASLSVGEAGRSTRLRLAAREACAARATVDLDVLDGIALRALEEPAVRERVVLRPNSTLARRGAALRYTEVRRGPGGRTCHLVSVESTPYLDDLLQRARGGALLPELAATLVASGADEPEARAYVHELVQTQILVPDFVPALTGPSPLRELVDAAAHAGADAAAALLADATGKLERVDAGSLRAAARALAPLTEERDPSRLFHVDLFRPGELQLGPRVLRELAHGAELAASLTPPPPEGALDAFRRAFVERYGEREIPLVAALDEESGIGFDVRGLQAAPVAGLPFGRTAEKAVVFSKREARLLALLTRAEREGRRELVLDDADLAALAVPGALPLPDACAVAATLVAASDEAIDRGEFRVVLEGVPGPSGARLLARFGHGDPHLAERLRAHLRAEEALRPDAVFVEVVHRPEGRIGNVLVRPLLREIELPLLARSGSPRQLTLDDLRVRVVGDRVVLRSSSLDREVLPRITTAHNHEIFGLAAYRFLGALQFQGVCANAGLSWGALEAAPFLPRLVHGRVVLCRARWLLEATELAPLSDPATCLARMQALRAARGLPRFITLQHGDRSLPIDLDNPSLVRAFALAVRSRAEVRVAELYPGPEELCVSSPAGHHVHELIVPFVREATASPPARLDRVPAPLPRSFPPGSEWLTVKVYCGRAAAEELLCGPLGERIDAALGSGAARGWFFLKYADPSPHLRLRLHGEPARLLGEVVPAIRDALAGPLAEGVVWRVQLDTYEREVERYGGAFAVPLAERIFQADSEAARAIIAGVPDAAARFRCALHGLRALAGDLQLAREQEEQLLRGLRASFLREQGGPRLEPDLSARFRAERSALSGGPDPALASILGARSKAIAPIVAQLLSLQEKGRLDGPVAALAPSLLHLHANRVLREEAREQELLLYDSWLRLLRSEAARAG